MAHPAKPGATVYGLSSFPSRRVSPEWAAWANGVAVRELDYHDTFLAAEYSHPGDNIPPLVAVAQQLGVRGADLIRGLATAYEIQIDLVKGICLHEHKIDHVANLGPSVAEHMAGAGRAFLRTRQHPAATAFAEVESFDGVYDEADTFDDVYRRIVDLLVVAAQDAATVGDFVAYGVPGSPLVAERPRGVSASVMVMLLPLAAENVIEESSAIVCEPGTEIRIGSSIAQTVSDTVASPPRPSGSVAL